MSSMISILIPTYNRGNIIYRILDSLENQSDKDFICIIVDDGSTDNTESIISKIKTQMSYKILYYKKENGGVLDAVKYGLKYVTTELVWFVGSDDELTFDAVEYMKKVWCSLSEEEQKKYHGIKAPCYDYETGKVVGRLFPKKINSMGLKKYFYYDKGEKTCMQRTEIMRKQYNDYPKILEGTGLKFIPEGTVALKYELLYRFYCVNKPVRIYHQDSSDSIVRSALTKESCFSQYLSHTYILKNYFPDKRLPVSWQFFHALYAIKFTLLLKSKLHRAYSDVGNFCNKIVLTLAIPFGIANFVFGKKLSNNKKIRMTTK